MYITALLLVSQCSFLFLQCGSLLGTTQTQKQLVLAASSSHHAAHAATYLILCFDCLPLGLVLSAELLSFPDHPVDLITVQGALVCGCDTQNAVGINVKLDLHLRHPPRCRWDAVQPKVT